MLRLSFLLFIGSLAGCQPDPSVATAEFRVKGQATVVETRSTAPQPAVGQPPAAADFRRPTEAQPASALLPMAGSGSVQFLDHVSDVGIVVPLPGGGFFMAEQVDNFTERLANTTAMQNRWAARRHNADGSVAWARWVHSMSAGPTLYTFGETHTYLHSSTIELRIELLDCPGAGPCAQPTVSVFLDLDTGADSAAPQDPALALPTGLSVTYEACDTGGQLRADYSGVEGDWTRFYPLPFAEAHIAATPTATHLLVAATSGRRTALFSALNAGLLAGALPEGFIETSCGASEPADSCVSGLTTQPGCEWLDVAQRSATGAGIAAVTDCPSPRVVGLDADGLELWSYPTLGAVQLRSLASGPLLVEETGVGVSLTALDGTDGTVRWSDVIAGRTLGDSSDDGSVAALILKDALDTAPGSERWVVQVGDDGVTASDLLAAVVGFASGLPIDDVKGNGWRVAVSGSTLCTFPVENYRDEGGYVTWTAGDMQFTSVGVNEGDCLVLAGARQSPMMAFPAAAIPYVDIHSYPAGLGVQGSGRFGSGLTAPDGRLLILGSRSFGYVPGEDTEQSIEGTYDQHVWNDPFHPLAMPSGLRRISDTHVAVLTPNGWRGARWDLGVCATEAP